MTPRPASSWLAAIATLVALGGGLPAAIAADGNPERGEAIYHRGVTAEGGSIEAALGEEGFVVDASVLPCSGCHGHDGKGKPEGGVSPSDLTWQSLTHPRGARNPAGRDHPPYDERSVLRAITMGLDPAGNTLSSTMPKYRLSHRDAADLVAYLRQLGDRRDPGISKDTLVIATLRTPGSAQASAVEGVLRAFFAELNERGGVYGRDVRLRTLDRSATAASEELVAELRAQLAQDPPFALVAADMTWREAELAKLFETQRLPVIGPFAVQPQLAMPPNRYVFYFLGGVEEQTRSLLDFAAHGLGEQASPKRLLIVRPEPVGHGPSAPATAEAWIQTALEQARLGPWTEVLTQTLQDLLAPSGPSSPRLAGDTVLMLNGGEELTRFLIRADAAGWHPRVLIPGVFAGTNVLSAPPSFDGRLYLAFPVLPSDARPQRLEEVWDLAQRHGLSQTHLAAQLSAVAAAQVLVEGLSRAGRELSREGLIESLEGLYDHDTGLLPAVTFNANRRLGARGAHVVRANLATRNFEPIGERIKPR